MEKLLEHDWVINAQVAGTLRLIRLVKCVFFVMPVQQSDLAEWLQRNGISSVPQSIQQRQFQAEAAAGGGGGCDVAASATPLSSEVPLSSSSLSSAVESSTSGSGGAV